MSEYKIDDSKICCGGCHLIFKKTAIYDDVIVYDVYALVGGSNGNEIEVGTVDNLNQVDRFIDEFEEKSGTKVIGKSFRDWRY